MCILNLYKMAVPHLWLPLIWKFSTIKLRNKSLKKARERYPQNFLHALVSMTHVICLICLVVDFYRLKCLLISRMMLPIYITCSSVSDVIICHVSVIYSLGTMLKNQFTHTGKPFHAFRKENICNLHVRCSILCGRHS